jgi:hypothetical protein
MLTIHTVRVAVRGGVVNSEAIAGPTRALLTPRRAPDAYRQHRQAAGAAAADDAAVSNEKGGRTSPALALAGEAMPDRRFPLPWSVEETDACFTVQNHARQALAYDYFEDEPGRCAAAKLLTRDERSRPIICEAAEAAGTASEE